MGNRSYDLEWDGKDEYNDNIGKAVYIYKLSVKDETGNRKEQIGKLVKF